MKSREYVENQIRTHFTLNEILDLLIKSQALLVGGFIRDLFFGCTSYDMDIVCPENSRALALEIAQKLEGTFIEIDCENEI